MSEHFSEAAMILAEIDEEAEPLTLDQRLAMASIHAQLAAVRATLSQVQHLATAGEQAARLVAINEEAIEMERAKIKPEVVAATPADSTRAVGHE